MEIQTLCLHGSKEESHCTGAVSVPIYQAATFAHPAVGESTGYDYSRLQNPTRENLEHIVANLEHGVDAIAFSTGMAAVTTVMELFSIGDHIIASDDLYGGSHRLFDNISRKNGLSFTMIDTEKETDLEKYIQENTKAIYLETPSNPMMKVTDITKIAETAKKHNLLLIVDNTFLTPYFQNPIDLGADIIIHSGTKYLAGHNDTLAGFAVVASEELSEKLRFIFKTTGACLSPFDSWLVIRGIKTLAIRMETQEKNALNLAKWLEQHPKIKKVYYVGLDTHPSYQISKKQARGFGGMISIEVDSEETAKKILERVKIILYAESLGGVETLITYPMLQTHADLSIEEREAKGINGRLLRISVGIEAVNDLISDIEQALA